MERCGTEGQRESIEDHIDESIDDRAVTVSLCGQQRSRPVKRGGVTCLFEFD